MAIENLRTKACTAVPPCHGILKANISGDTLILSCVTKAPRVIEHLAAEYIGDKLHST